MSLAAEPGDNSEQESSESGDSSSSAECSKIGQKRKFRGSTSIGKRPLKKARTKVPALKSVSKFFTNKSVQKIGDNSPMHQGKRRRFAHQEGNWCVHVYIPGPPRWTNIIGNLYTEVSGQCAVDQVTHSIEALHVSLSIAQPIHCAKIDDFVQTMTESMECKSFEMSLSNEKGFKCFSNPSGDRHFGALLIGQGREEIIDLIDRCNGRLQKWGLQEYHENPQPHISFIWSLNPFHFTKEQILRIERVVEKGIDKDDERVSVDHIVIKVGNRLYTVKLS